MEDTNKLYREVAERAKANGVTNQEAWDGIVDEIVEEYISEGGISPEEDTNEIVEELRVRYPEFEEQVNQEGF